MSPRSLSRMLAGGAAALILTASTACAGDASQIATRGGFLLGHAYRCGVASDRLQPAARMVQQLIAALSLDSDEETAADQKFIDEVLASGLAEAPGVPLPSCGAIRRDFALFEQHQRLVSLPGEAAMSDENPLPKPKSQNHSVKPVRSKKPTSTQPEGLSPERRAKIALKLAAQEQRRRPPSI